MSDNNSRITKVTTRNGDAGQTRLGNNVKVSKDAPLIRALGSTDELNSAIGLLRCYIDETCVDSMLAEQQQMLFDIGAVLAMAGEYDPPTLTTGLTALEEQTEEMNNKLPPLTEFVIPGGSLPTAQAHLCRTICRRAETDLWGAIGAWEERVESAQAARLHGAGAYLNRLSDFFFVLARTLGQSQGQTEPQWHGPSNS